MLLITEHDGDCLISRRDGF